MRIHVTAGTGTGPTPLAAFDAALIDAGVANYNLLALSSVIPIGSVIECAPYVTQEKEYGHRLYVVISQHGAVEPEQEAWAGLGWIQDAKGRGLFVELHGASKSEVQEAIFVTLESMRASRRYEYGPVQNQIIGIQCVDQPVCAVVIAVYESQGWAN